MPLIIQIQWTAFCYDGWVATRHTSEVAYLIKASERWYAQVAGDMTEPPPHDSFEEARRYVYGKLGIDYSPTHLQILLTHGHRTSR